MQLRSLAFVAALLIWAPCLCNALYFYLEAGENRCFLEELPKDTIVVGELAGAVARVTRRRRGPDHAPPRLHLRVCSLAGHYKAEEWQESTKSYIVNDQLGIQIVVAVR